MLFALPVLVFAKSTLNLKQITQIAIENNRDLKAARFNVSIASARLVQAGLWSNPSLNLTSNDDRAFNNEGEYSRTAGFTQAFPISGRIAQQKKVARVDIAKAMAEIREAERQLTANVANAFYAVVVTERRLHQQNYLLKLNQQLVEVTHNRYHVAEVSELDNNTARLEYQRISQEKQLLESIKISQVAQLNQLLGRTATAPLRLDSSLPNETRWPKLNTLQAIALKNRPDRHALLLGVQRANASIHLARAERFADWTIGLGVQQDKIVVEGAPAQPADRTLGVSLSVPLPLLNGNQGRILEASATGTQGLLALRALNLAIETQVASNYAQLKILQHTLHQTQSQSLQLTLKNVQLAREAYKNGQLSLLNLVQVQRQQNDFQLAYLTNLEKYLQVHVALCTAIGAGEPIAPCDYLSYKRNLNVPTHAKSL
jgi:cobalt-zinc-cadmium efflux system outer membrane protein